MLVFCMICGFITYPVIAPTRFFRILSIITGDYTAVTTAASIVNTRVNELFGVAVGLFRLNDSELDTPRLRSAW